jgi:hypothetical protein
MIFKLLMSNICTDTKHCLRRRWVFFFFMSVYVVLDTNCLVIYICLICSKTLVQKLELGNAILEIRAVLYGNGGSEPNPDACAQLTQEFFREDTFRLIIMCLPKLDSGVSMNQ